MFPSASIFLEQIVENWYYLFLKYLVDFTSGIILAWHLSVSYTYHHWTKTIKEIWIHNSLINYSRMKLNFLHCTKYFILHFFHFLFVCISPEERSVYGVCVCVFVCVCCRPWALEGKRKMRNYERGQMNKLEVTEKYGGCWDKEAWLFSLRKRSSQKFLIHLFLNLDF